MGRNAQAKAIREFSWEHIARETEDVYYELLNLKNAPRTENIYGGYSLSNALLRERCFNMSIADGDSAVARGLSILKLTKLLVASLAGKAVMTWMGNEFAQIDTADMPRQGNGYSDECSRVKYELADNEDLKFRQMAAFEATLNTMAKRHNWLACSKHEMLTQCEESKLVAYARGTCLFVFNLHPTKDLHECAVSLPATLAGSPLACVLNTDEAQFAGSANSLAVIAAEQKQRGYLTMNLRSRSAVVLAPAEMQMGA
jgi:1,4-alpha-glucan branching enzyme